MPGPGRELGGADHATAKTGAAQRARVTLPAGFEFTDAEFASRPTNGRRGDIPLDFSDTHAHLARIHWSTHGVVRLGA